MKRLNYLMNGLAALALIVYLLNVPAILINRQQALLHKPADYRKMKIAYVEIDTLLAKYNYCIDLNEAMVKRARMSV